MVGVIEAQQGLLPADWTVIVLVRIEAYTRSGYMKPSSG
jgi:hypothetical protein